MKLQFYFPYFLASILFSSTYLFGDDREIVEEHAKIEHCLFVIRGDMEFSKIRNFIIQSAIHVENVSISGVLFPLSLREPPPFTSNEDYSSYKIERLDDLNSLIDSKIDVKKQSLIVYFGDKMTLNSVVEIAKVLNAGQVQWMMAGFSNNNNKMATITVVP